MRTFTQLPISRRWLVVLLAIGLALTPLLPGHAAQRSPQNGDDERERGRDKGRLSDCAPIQSRDNDRDQDDDQQGARNDGNGRDQAKGKNGRHQEDCLAAGSSSGIARGDFNGDGFADLAIGVPGESIGDKTNAGAVNVIYGSPSGLTTDPSRPLPQRWSQNATGVPGVAEAGDGFGSALAAGDFNGDTFSDLAIGIPGEDIESLFSFAPNTGEVTIIYGSGAGLTSTDPSVPAAHDICVFCSSRFGESEFGRALAWGDFNGDSVGDLAVGAPGEDPPCLANACVCPSDNPDCDGPVGGAYIYYGLQDFGLGSLVRPVHLSVPNSPEGPSRGDRFGATLAGGDFDGDGITDIAIGIPFFDTGTIAARQNVGVVLVMFGQLGDTISFDGRFQFLPLFLCSIGGDECILPSRNDRFGTAFAAGDFNGDTVDDLAIAAPLRSVSGLSQAGALMVFHGPFDIFDPTRQQFWTQSLVFPGLDQLDEVAGGGSPSEPFDQFGTALAAGDFNGDGREDLAVGSPLETLLVIPLGATLPTQIENAGAVTVIYGSRVGLSIDPVDGGRRPQLWTQQFNTKDEPETFDNFGASLTAWNFGRNEFDLLCVVCPRDSIHRTADLAIGVPLEDFGSARDAGAVNVLYGSFDNNGLVVTNDQLWHQDSHPALGGRETGDRFGAAVY